MSIKVGETLKLLCYGGKSADFAYYLLIIIVDLLIIVPNSSCRNVMFLQASVFPQ